MKDGKDQDNRDHGLSKDDDHDDVSEKDSSPALPRLLPVLGVCFPHLLLLPDLVLHVSLLLGVFTDLVLMTLPLALKVGKQLHDHDADSLLQENWIVLINDS